MPTAPEKSKVAEADDDGSFGPLRIVGTAAGGVRSSVHVYEVAEPVLPAASARRTWSVCTASASVAVVYGVAHVAHAPVSSLHW